MFDNLHTSRLLVGLVTLALCITTCSFAVCFVPWFGAVNNRGYLSSRCGSGRGNPDYVRERLDGHDPVADTSRPGETHNVIWAH